ncbi:MAG: glycoside hydrolase family 16 protein [Gemmatimonadetes bacterium]|nr:glycoside hydrolase family 16 protein [Gemmatimonadota bacterium]
MPRLQIQRLVRQPARAVSAPWPAIFFGLALAACSDSPFDPVDSAAPAPALPPAVSLNPATASEPFDAFDGAVWLVQEHVLGRGPLLASNVTVASSQLRLALDASGYEGGEIASRRTFGAGSYAAALRCGAPAGALCAFFFYQPNAGNRADEIDIEILGGTRTIWFTTWVGGRRTNHVSRTLPFDPAAGTHTYGIVRSGSSVAFYVDGAQLASFRRKVPVSRMALLVNAWWPTWLTPAPGSTGSLDVDWIDWS